MEASRPDADNLGLVARSVGRPIPEAVRNALAHRGFRDRFGQASTPAEFDALARQIETTLPASVDPKALTSIDPSWLTAYAKDPAATYREAPDAVRCGSIAGSWPIRSSDRSSGNSISRQRMRLDSRRPPSSGCPIVPTSPNDSASEPWWSRKLGVTTMRQAEVEEARSQVPRARGQGSSQSSDPDLAGRPPQDPPDAPATPKDESCSPPATTSSWETGPPRPTSFERRWRSTPSRKRPSMPSCGWVTARGTMAGMIRTKPERLRQTPATKPQTEVQGEFRAILATRSKV